MILIVAVDDRKGMMFHNRRQSQDRILRENILSMTQGSKLWMNQYTFEQFKECFNSQIAVAEDFLERAEEGEYCFVEDRSVLPYLDQIERVVLYLWNRRYPGDFFFDINLSDDEWKLETVKEFSGFSHKKITMEVYDHV